MKFLTLRAGGSNRKLERQFRIFQEAGVKPYDVGTAALGIHASNRTWIVPDTAEVRELAKRAGVSVARRQFYPDSRTNPPIRWHEHKDGYQWDAYLPDRSRVAVVMPYGGSWWVRIDGGREVEFDGLLRAQRYVENFHADEHKNPPKRLTVREILGSHNDQTRGQFMREAGKAAKASVIEGRRGGSGATSGNSDVRSPTSTKTDAYTAGNVTVTGGAGKGNTVVHIKGARSNPADSMRTVPAGMIGGLARRRMSEQERVLRFAVGDRVWVKVPTLHGMSRQPGTVKFLRPDGKIEVKLQGGGYGVGLPQDFERFDSGAKSNPPKFLVTEQHGKVLVRWRIDSPSVNELTDGMRERAEANMRELVKRGIAETGYYTLAIRQGAKELDGEDMIA